MMIKVFQNSDKLNEVYDKFLQVMDTLIEDYQLNYYELFGILKCYECDLVKSNIQEE